MVTLCGEDTSLAAMIDKSDTTTLLDTFEKWCIETPNRQWMCQPMGGDATNLKTYTFAEGREEMLKMAAYLTSLNLEKGSRIALMSKNCAWWILADLAILTAGHVTVPIYPTLTADTVEYTLTHSEAQLCFVGKLDDGPWNEMKNGIAASIPTITFPLVPSSATSNPENKLWADIMESTSPLSSVEKRTADEMATIIYTSGSTGKPKGVMHSFQTLYVTTEGLATNVKATSSDRYLSYLPLAHGMERWIGECISIYCGSQVFFADSLKTFVEDLNRARPTLFMSVPRLWTKFQAGVHKKMPPKKLAMLLKIPLLNILVRKKIVKGLGLDSCRLAGSGSAPIPGELIQWYRSLGLELLEGYGMTENFNYSHISLPGKARVGYVGNCHIGVEARIADNGEIQVKSPGLMMGYYKNEEATKEVVTEDGYLCTGDRGEIDAQGRLKITGRTKEIFKTSKGKYVAPAPIENLFITHNKIELACVSGSSYPQPNAVLQLNDDAKIAASDASVRDEIGAELETHLQTVNGKVDAHEACAFVVVLKDTWLPENGFLTPTQKIVRSKIESEYKDYLDGWYGMKKKVIWHGW